MTQYQRITGKVFGGNATATGNDPQIAQFGSALANTFVGTTDPETIQSLPAWGQGWIGAVTPETQFPPLPEMTGAMKVLSHQICGILQQGVSTWDSGTIYYTGNFVSLDGKLYISQTDENQGNNPATDTTNWQEFSGGGGGLEIGDIGIAPLGIDETKGKRRYLNGQIIVQDQYAIFSEKVKNTINLYPTLGCTEQEWQTIATMSVGGQVGKFVVDNEGGTIRLPKIIMPIQGLTDLSKLAEIVEAGLPNITGNAEINSASPQGAFYSGTLGAYALYTFGNDIGKLSIDASRSSEVYGNSDTVQQEQIQYPYFIQVATGSETEDNIINEIELNNPYTLFDSKYVEAPLYNVSWLYANGTFNGSNAVHPSAYQALLVENNAEIEVGSTVTLPIGTEYTKRGLSVKLSTDSDITDYDFVVNTSDETFRLPLLNGEENIQTNEYVDLTFKETGKTYEAESNGWYFLDKKGSAVGQHITIWNINKGYGEAETCEAVGVSCRIKIWVTKGDVLSVNYTLAGNTDYFRFFPAKGNGSLYYYVGETVQNANLVNVGRIEEKLNECLTRSDKEEIISWGIPDYTAGVSLSTTAGSTFQATTAGIIIVYRNQTTATVNTNIAISIDGVYVMGGSGYSANSAHRSDCYLAPIDKDSVMKVESNATNNSSITFYPMKGAK